MTLSPFFTPSDFSAFAVRPNLVQQLAVGHLPLRAVLTHPYVGDFIFASGFHLAIKAVMRDVEFAALEPLKRRILPVKNFRPRTEPFQLIRGVGPERFRIFDGPLVFRGVIFQARIFDQRFWRQKFVFGV